MYHVFVYGTLKHGHGLNQVLVAGGARFVGCGYVDDVRLYSWGLCPAAYREEGSRAWGEVYEINAALLGRLDRIETSYERERMPVVIIEGAGDLSPVTAWIYMGLHNPVGGHWVADGVFHSRDGN